MTTAGTDLSLQSFVQVFSKYLFVKAVMALVAFCRAIACSSGFFVDCRFEAERRVGGCESDWKAVASPKQAATTSPRLAIARVFILVLLTDPTFRCHQGSKRRNEVTMTRRISRLIRECDEPASDPVVHVTTDSCPSGTLLILALTVSAARSKFPSQRLRGFDSAPLAHSYRPSPWQAIKAALRWISVAREPDGGIRVASYRPSLAAKRRHCIPANMASSLVLPR